MRDGGDADGDNERLVKMRNEFNHLKKSLTVSW